MGIKLIHNQRYILKETGKVVNIYKDSDGSFWYWKDVDSIDRLIVKVTEKDILSHAYISYGGTDTIEIGDIVVYISGGYKSSPSADIGQVIGFKNARVTVRFNDGQFGTSNLAPNNLLVVTDKKLREKYNWIK